MQTGTLLIRYIVCVDQQNVVDPSDWLGIVYPICLHIPDISDPGAGICRQETSCTLGRVDDTGCDKTSWITMEGPQAISLLCSSSSSDSRLVNTAQQVLS